MFTLKTMGRGVAATGAAGLLSLGLATTASADAPRGPAANQPENWEAYLVEEGYVDPMCEKFDDGFEGSSWTSDGDYVLVVLKAGSEQSSEGDPRTVFEWVEKGEELETEDGKDISHIIVCTADMEEETSTPTPTTPPPSTTTPTPTVSTTTTTPTPSGPIVETDVPATSSNTMPAVLGGAAVLAGLGLAAGAMRRKGQH